MLQYAKSGCFFHQLRYGLPPALLLKTSPVPEVSAWPEGLNAIFHRFSDQWGWAPTPDMLRQPVTRTAWGKALPQQDLYSWVKAHPFPPWGQKSHQPLLQAHKQCLPSTAQPLCPPSPLPEPHTPHLPTGPCSHLKVLPANTQTHTGFGGDTDAHPQPPHPVHSPQFPLVLHCSHTRSWKLRPKPTHTGLSLPAACFLSPESYGLSSLWCGDPPSFSHIPPFISPAASTSALQHKCLANESMKTAKKRFNKMQEDRTDRSFGEQAQDSVRQAHWHCFTQPTPFMSLSVHHPLCSSPLTFSAPFPRQCLGSPRLSEVRSRGEVQVDPPVRSICPSNSTAQRCVSLYCLHVCFLRSVPPLIFIPSFPFFPYFSNWQGSQAGKFMEINILTFTCPCSALITASLITNLSSLCLCTLCLWLTPLLITLHRKRPLTRYPPYININSLIHVNKNIFLLGNFSLHKPLPPTGLFFLKALFNDKNIPYTQSRDSSKKEKKTTS